MLNTLVQLSRGLMSKVPLLPVAAGLIVGIAIDSQCTLWSRSLRLGLLVYIVPFVAISVLIAIRRRGVGMGRVPTAAGEPDTSGQDTTETRKTVDRTTAGRAVLATLGPLLVFLSSVCVGGVLHLGAARTIPALSIERHLDVHQGQVRPGRRIARLRGTVASKPRLRQRQRDLLGRWMSPEGRTTFLLDVESIEGPDVDIVSTGVVRVVVNEAILDLGQSERVEAFGWLYRFQPPRNPGSFDWAAFQRRQGVAAGMQCEHQENVRRLDDDPPSRSGEGLTRLRAHVRGLLISDLAGSTTDEEASLLEAMVLGHRSQLDRKLNDVFIRAGCVHFLAVSGLHLAVPMSFVWWLGRRLGRSGRQCAWLMLGSVVAYVMIAEPRPPILRAGIMGTLLCLSLILERPRSGVNWLAAAAIVLVLISPQSVFDAGFQLSFASVLGILCFASSIRESLAAVGRLAQQVVLRRCIDENDLSALVSHGSRHRRWDNLRRTARRIWNRYALWPFAVAFSAFVASLPIVALHFHQIHPWAAVNSLLVFPFVYVLILSAFAKIVVEVACPGWGSVFAEPVTLVQDWLIRLVDSLGSLPGATWYVPPPPWWWVFAWYLFLLAFVWRFRPAAPKLDERTREFVQASPARPRWRSATCGAALVLLVFSSVAWCWPKGPSNRLVVTVLSVGAGSAMVVELPGGQTLLCDAGNTSSYDVGHHTVVPFLRARGIRRIERIYISHPNVDHYSGVPSIVEAIETGLVVVNEYFPQRSRPDSTSGRLLEFVAERGRALEILDPSDPSWNVGGVEFELLWPPPNLSAAVPTNETSTVLRLTYAGHSILLTGDIEDCAQRAVLEQGDLAADVLVLPHHGGVESSSKAFIAAVGARVLVRSSHEPRAETLNGLYEIAGKTPIFNTADVGAVEIVIDKDGVEVSSVWGSE